jgi:hypothetical protein
VARQPFHGALTGKALWGLVLDNHTVTSREALFASELLTFIRHCRDFGFPIEQVRELVSLSKSRERDCFETLKIAQAHLAAVRAKMAELRTLERGLTRFARSCSEMCAGGLAAQCSIRKHMMTPQVASKGHCGSSSDARLKPKIASPAGHGAYSTAMFSQQPAPHDSTTGASVRAVSFLRARHAGAQQSLRPSAFLELAPRRTGRDREPDLLPSQGYLSAATPG